MRRHSLSLCHLLQVCEEVRQEVPTDEQILVTMTLVYRKANHMQALAEAYAAASAARPKDGSLLRGVFANHVRHVALPS